MQSIDVRRLAIPVVLAVALVVAVSGLAFQAALLTSHLDDVTVQLENNTGAIQRLAEVVAKDVDDHLDGIDVRLERLETNLRVHLDNHPDGLLRDEIRGHAADDRRHN